MDNILITGGAGYIGSHMAKYCSENNLNPIILDNLSTGNKSALLWGDFEEGDLKNIDFINDVLQKHKPIAVIHFAASAYVGESVNSPSKYYENNVLTTKNLLDSMLLNNINNLIFSSSCAIFGEPNINLIDEECNKSPINPYGRTKLICENMINDYSRAYALRAICLRYFNAAGADPSGVIGEEHNPETHVIPLLLDSVFKNKTFKIYGNDYPTIDGTCIRDYIHVNDLASAHFNALKNIKKSTFEVFNLGIGQGYSILELINNVEKVLGCKVSYEFEQRRAGDPSRLVADPSKAMKYLVWKPKYNNIEKIIKTAISYMENKDA